MDNKKDRDFSGDLKNFTQDLFQYFEGETKKLKANPKKMPRGYTPEMRAMFLEFSDHAEACLTEIQNIEQAILSEFNSSDLNLSPEKIAQIIESQKKAKLKDVARTVLTLACASGMDIEQCLAFAKNFGITDLSSFDSKIGLSPLAAAMLRRENSIKAMKELQAAGADLHAISAEGNNIAHLAVLFGVDKKNLDYLIKQKVDFNLVNRQGMTPLDMAAGRRDTDFIKYLIENAGAKFNFTPIKIQNLLLEKMFAEGKGFAREKKARASFAEKEEELTKEKTTKTSDSEVKKTEERKNLEEKNPQQQDLNKDSNLALEQKTKAQQVANNQQEQQLSDSLQQQKHDRDNLAKKAKEQEELRLREQEQNNRDRAQFRESLAQIETNFLSDFVRGVIMFKDAISQVAKDIEYSVESQVIEQMENLTEEQFLLGELVKDLRDDNLVHSQQNHQQNQGQHRGQNQQQGEAKSPNSWREFVAKMQQDKQHISENKSWTEILEKTKKSATDLADSSRDFLQNIIKQKDQSKGASFTEAFSKGSSQIQKSENGASVARASGNGQNTGRS